MKPFDSKSEIQTFAQETAKGDFGCLLREVNEQRMSLTRIRVTIDARYDLTFAYNE